MNITYDIIETHNDLIDNSDDSNVYIETDYSLYNSDEILALVTNYNLKID